MQQALFIYIIYICLYNKKILNSSALMMFRAAEELKVGVMEMLGDKSMYCVCVVLY